MFQTFPSEPTIVSRLPNVGTTIFTVMSQLAAKHKAIDLGQGYPNFDPDNALIEAAHQALLGSRNQYAPMAGVPELRQVISQKTRLVTGHTYDPEHEITVTSGATQALMTAIMTCVQPGDEVIVLEPVYDSYIPAIRMAGGVPVVVTMTPPDLRKPGFQPDWQKVKDALTPRTRALILNFPHNPTGTVLSEADLDMLEDFLADSNIIVISDEVYEHIVFGDKPHRSLASRAALAARTYLVSSFGKTVHATGWKVGYCCAPTKLTQEFRRIHQFVVFAVATPLQHALAAYLEQPETYQSLAAFYEHKRDHLTAGLHTTGFVPLPSEGTFFLLADYEAISELPPAEFAQWLTVHHGVTVIPLSAFYVSPEAIGASRRLVRFCFAKKEETLDMALKRLRNLRSISK